MISLGQLWHARNSVAALGDIDAGILGTVVLPGGSFQSQKSALCPVTVSFTGIAKTSRKYVPGMSDAQRRNKEISSYIHALQKKPAMLNTMVCIL